MKKIFLFVIIGLLPLSPRNGASQINAYSVSIEISGIKVIRNCFFSDLQGQTNSFDTMEVAFALSTFPELTLIDTIITSNQSYHGINGDNRSETLNIVLDTNRKKIKNLGSRQVERIKFAVTC